jgi:hypothetical protein
MRAKPISRWATDKYGSEFNLLLDSGLGGAGFRERFWLFR